MNSPLFAGDEHIGETRRMAHAYIGLGCNLGDRLAHLRRASAMMADLPGVDALRLSGVYETDPVGPQDQGRFLNAAAQLRTSLAPYDLFEALQQIEREMGREPVEQRRPWGPRIMDLDLLLLDDLVLQDRDLTLPHPRMHERRFVLVPLCDLNPQLHHPVLNATMAQLLARLPEHERIERYDQPDDQ